MKQNDKIIFSIIIGIGMCITWYSHPYYFNLLGLIKAVEIFLNFFDHYK